MNVGDNLQHNLNQCYVAGQMTAAMIAIEIPLMNDFVRDRDMAAMLSELRGR